MKNLFIIAIAAVFCLSAAPAWAKPQQECPVIGGPINKNVYTDYKGKRIYFCCNGCPEEFRKNPEKYMDKMKKEGVELENAPTAPAPGSAPPQAQKSQQP